MSGLGRGASPRAVGAMTTTLVLLVGIGFGAYFIEVRGAGLQAELQGAQAGEILVLAAGLAVVAATSFFAVAGAAGAARGGGGAAGSRDLVQRALDADVDDPGAVTDLAAAPELQDLANALRAERTRTRELSDQIEAHNGELEGLLQGMQRSAQGLGRMREEGSSERAAQVVRLWNDLVERARRAELSAAVAAEVVPAAVPEPVPAGLQVLVQRLDSLESELQRLRALRPESARADETARRPFELASGGTSGTGAQAGARERDYPRFDFGEAAAPAAMPFELDYAGAAPTPPSGAVPAAPQPAEPAGFWADEDAPQSGLEIPHFVGRPVRPIPDRVEVTYESPDGQEAEDLPPSALLFETEDVEPEPDPVIDLRDLGAMELRT